MRISDWSSDVCSSDVSIAPDFSAPQVALARETAMLPQPARRALAKGLRVWLEARLEPLTPLRMLAQAAPDSQVGSHARARLHTLLAGHGLVSREPPWPLRRARGMHRVCREGC